MSELGKRCRTRIAYTFELPKYVIARTAWTDTILLVSGRVVSSSSLLKFFHSCHFSAISNVLGVIVFFGDFQ